MPVARLIPQPEKVQVELAGPRDGINLTFTTPDIFVESSIKVFRNGVREMNDLANDFTLAESGGPGTGFDTVIFTDRAPLSNENLFADYVVAP